MPVKLSTTHPGLLALIPQLHESQIILTADLYGSNDFDVPLYEYPQHHRPPASNIIGLTSRGLRTSGKLLAAGRCLIDIEHGGDLTTVNASGYTVESRGDWDFTTTADWPNTTQRDKDVLNYHVDLRLALREIVPGIEISWWLTPPSAGSQYFHYRELVTTGSSAGVDSLRTFASNFPENVADYVTVLHYVSPDSLGQTFNSVTWTMEKVAEVVEEKVATARLTGLPISVYAHPYFEDGMMTEAQCLQYLRDIEAVDDVDEIVLWENPAVTHTAESPVAKAVMSFLESSP